MTMITEILTREEYDSFVKRGREPLIEKAFHLDIDLRREIQKEKFGGNDASGNQKFYQFCILHKLLVCEECGRAITSPTATNVSHIISRGADARMAHDPRNVNILCPRCHSLWEHATTRKGMRILNKNNKTIELLKREYNVESKCR